MSNGFYGWSGSPPLESEVRGTALRLTGRPGATAGGGLGGVTTSGAPTSGAFSAGEAVLSQDGTLWICTVSGSPGTWSQLGTLIDPTSVRGDLIVRGASATTRLALGTTNYVLTSNGTDAVWNVVPAGAGGAMTSIAETIVSGSAAASVTFASIPGTYRNLVLTITGRSTGAVANAAAQWQANGDTAANYATDMWYANGGTGGADPGSSTTSGFLGYIAGANFGSNIVGVVRATFLDYARTQWYKSSTGTFAVAPAPTGTWLSGAHGATWASTAAITSLLLKLNSGSFAIGTVLTLWGEV